MNKKPPKAERGELRQAILVGLTAEHGLNDKGIQAVDWLLSFFNSWDMVEILEVLERGERSAKRRAVEGSPK